jgi:hypothetical protein
MLSPERGTLLDRFLPVLLLGALALAVLTQTHLRAFVANVACRSRAALRRCDTALILDFAYERAT